MSILKASSLILIPNNTLC
uniref:Uncharacterized protein n=1 Tax=Anguilla anguilla TaxID=7936 RepID=A0A0E9XIU9_ANGAN